MVNRVYTGRERIKSYLDSEAARIIGERDERVRSLGIRSAKYQTPRALPPAFVERQLRHDSTNTRIFKAYRPK